MRVLFSFSLIGAKPKTPLLTQSSPAQRVPLISPSSGVTAAGAEKSERRWLRSLVTGLPDTTPRERCCGSLLIFFADVSRRSVDSVSFQTYTTPFFTGNYADWSKHFNDNLLR